DPAYNVPTALRLRGELDAGALARALAALAARHEALRTTFDERGGRPVALVHDEAFAPPLRETDLRPLDEASRDSALAGLAAAEAGAPFDLRRGPLVRAALVRLDEREHALLLTIHHAVTDGWSTAIVVRELALLYEAFARGEAPRLPELPLQYADYAAWQRERLAGPRLRAELDHWRRTLEGAPRLELPTDRPRRADASGRRAGSAAVALPAPLAGRLLALAAAEGCTPFMALLAGFQALLARYAGADDVSVGTPVAGRTRLEFEGLVGLFVNTLVVRARVEPARSFRALLGRVREASLEAFAHQELPFERLVEELRPERDLSGTPLFRAFFSLQNAPRPDATVAGLSFSPLALPIAAAKFDLSLRLEERDGAFEGALDYRADLFESATAERLSRHFAALLSSALAAPDRP
ncbi:MAG TPA: condensation domain-containing protein, partial [Polyangiaceae bacterium]|nr:condensation domain-containing protein [Polyangiaceae bacterium]